MGCIAFVRPGVPMAGATSVRRTDALEPDSIRSIHSLVSWARLPVDPRCRPFEKVWKTFEDDRSGGFACPTRSTSYRALGGSESARMLPGCLG